MEIIERVGFVMKKLLFLVALIGLFALGCRAPADKTTALSSTDGEVGEDVADADAEPADDKQTDAGPSDEAIADDGTSDDGTSDDGTSDDDETSDDDQAGDDGDLLETDTLGASLLARTLSDTPEVSTARFEGRFSLVGAPHSELPGGIEMTFSGAYDLANQASDVSIDFSGLVEAMAEADTSDEEFEFLAGFFAEPIRIITIGDTAWINWSFFTSFLGGEAPPGKVWIEGEADEAGAMTPDIGFGQSGSPTDILEWFEDGEATIEKRGRESLRGVETTRYSVRVDLDSLAETMTEEERLEFEASMQSGLDGELPIDFWIDDDGLVRKFVLDVADPELLNEGEFVSATVEFEMYDIGEPIAIDPPPADEILTEDELGFNLEGF